MIFTPKIFIVALILIGAVFASFTIIRLGGLLIPSTAPGSTSTPPGGVPTQPGGQIPLNAFLPPASADPALGNQIEQPSQLPPAPQTPQLSLPEIQKKIEAALPPPASPAEMLALPVIPDSEIAITSTGIRTEDEYLLYFATHIKDVPFDYARLKSAQTSKESGVILPPDLIEKVLAGETSATLRQSIETFRDLALAKAEYLKKVAVSSGAVSIHKRMIAFEELHAELLDKAVAVASGGGSKDELRTFYNKFKTTALQENSSSIGKFGLLKTKKNFFADLTDRVAEFFGFKKRASAAVSLIGGVFTAFAPCPCPAPLSQVVAIVGTNPIILNVYFAWAATPALFPYKAMHSGAFWLGLYVPGTVPCLMWAVCGVSPCCVPNTIPPGPVGMLPLIAGTSQ